LATNYTTDLQRLFLEMMLGDAQTFVRVQNIFNSENFDRSLREGAKFIEDHTRDHSTMPAIEQVNAACGLTLKPVEQLTSGHYEWFMVEFEGFTKKQELERAILAAADMIEKGEYEPVEKLIKDAVQISLTNDLGIEYWTNPRERLMRLKDGNGQISTGWPTLDRKLFGGFNKGELNIFAGGSGSGKSLFMQNLAINWALQSLSGVYLTLELSEGLCAMRLDSMVTDVPSKDIFKDLDTVEMKIGMTAKKAGSLRIKYMAAQSNINDIRAYLKELQIQTGNPLDFICVDYLDLLMPVSAKVSPNDQFIKDKYVSEELRNLAKEFNIIMVTASQLNRAAVEEIEFDHSHIAGGISKINTADNVIGIFTSRAMKERGRYQIQFMKTRSSSGVGQKVDLGWDEGSLRITDLGEEDEGSGAQTFKATEMMNKIKSNVGSEGTEDYQPEPKVRANIQSNKLHDMLKGLKTS